MAQVEEKWLPIALRIVRGEYLKPLRNIWDKVEEAQALAEFLASHVPEGAMKDTASLTGSRSRVNKAGSHDPEGLGRQSGSMVSESGTPTNSGPGHAPVAVEPKHFVCIGCKCGPHAFVDQHSPARAEAAEKALGEKEGKDA